MRDKKKRCYGAIWERVPLLILLTLEIVLFSVLETSFFTWGNLSNIFLQSTTIGIVGIGLGMVVLGGRFDLSCGAIMALTGVFCARLLTCGVEPGIVIVCGLAFGGLLGGINGWLVTRLQFSSFLLTLVTSLIYRGSALALAGGENLYRLPESFCWIGTGKIGILDVPVILMFFLYLFFGWVLSHTVFGQQLYVVGNSGKIADELQIPTNRVTVTAYILAGGLSALVGMILVGRMSVANPSIGDGIELNVLSGLVIGGISIGGGRGTLFGGFLGCMLVSVLIIGLDFLNLSTYSTSWIRGMLILFAIVCEALRVRGEQREKELPV